MAAARLSWRLCVGALAVLSLAYVVPQLAARYQQQRSAQRMAEDAAAARLAAQRQIEAATIQERSRRDAVADQDAARETRARELADTASQQESKRRAAALQRERAWAQFYVRSERCKVATDVECANEFIRAKRAFDAKWPAIAP